MWNLIKNLTSNKVPVLSPLISDLSGQFMANYVTSVSSATSSPLILSSFHSVPTRRPLVKLDGVDTLLGHLWIGKKEPVPEVQQSPAKNWRPLLRGGADGVVALLSGTLFGWGENSFRSRDVKFSIQIWGRLAPNMTNLGLFKISFSTLWLTEPKCAETDL